MGHPLIDEFCRVRGVQNCQPNFFNRCQLTFRNEVQPLIERGEAAIARVAELEAELETLKSRKREKVPA